MRKFLGCKQGNIAVTFAITIMPVLGAAGMAIDYSRAVNVRSFVQSQADMTAFRGAQLGPGADDSAILDYLQFVTAQRYGAGGWIGTMTVHGEWLSEVDYRVSVTGEVPVSILGAVPGFPAIVPFSVDSIVRVAEPRYIYTAPEADELDYEAGDYNQISVYCFNPNNKDDPETKGRTQMTVIADNYYSKGHYEYEMPRCEAGEVLSFKLLNVRRVRTEPHRWNSGPYGRFEYYTDTVIDENGAEKYNISCTGHQVCNNPPAGGWSIVETVLCNNRQQCDPDHPQSIIPEGRDRAPQLATQSCQPGKFMYYGWEDRPPGLPGSSNDWTDLAWTDRDYDDIRIVLACPSLEKVEDRVVRLIK